MFLCARLATLSCFCLAFALVVSFAPAFFFPNCMGSFYHKHSFQRIVSGIAVVLQWRLCTYSWRPARGDLHVNDGVLCYEPKKRWELKGEMPPRMDRFCAGGSR